MAHRRMVADELAKLVGDGWTEILGGQGVRGAERERATQEALAAGAPFIWAPQLPRDPDGNRRGAIDLLVRTTGGYVPILVVRHKVSDPGAGARTSPLDDPVPAGSTIDPVRKSRAQPRDQLRLAHARRMLQAGGYADEARADRWRDRPGRPTSSSGTTWTRPPGRAGGPRSSSTTPGSPTGSPSPRPPRPVVRRWPSRPGSWSAAAARGGRCASGSCSPTATSAWSCAARTRSPCASAACVTVDELAALDPHAEAEAAECRWSACRSRTPSAWPGRGSPT